MFTRLRSPWSAGIGIAALLAGTAAGAATIHRLAISTTSGSGGAQTYLQTSATGAALQGEVASTPQTAIKIPFGVLGEYDAAGGGFGIGTVGISTTGYGVGAESLSTSQPSLIALSGSSGPAAEMYGKNGGLGADIEATGGGVGVYTFSDSSNAVAAYSQTPFYAAVFASDQANSSGYGLAGNSFSTGGVGSYGGGSYGVGVQADSESDTPGLPAIQAYSSTDGTELFDAGVNDSNTGNSLSISTVLSSVSNNTSGGVYTAGAASSDLEINGDIKITGAIYTNCGNTVPYAGDDCGGDQTLVKQRSPAGANYDMYASKHASQTLEDEGEAVLRNGVSHVTLDPSFGAVISTRQPYLVFTTPQGDTRGLYVTNRTATGFDVRETGGGHNSLTFDYRIVAHPFGSESKRMGLSKAKQRTIAGGGRPKASRALAAHNALLAHIMAQQAHRKAFVPKKIPASLVSLR